jgi:hypothetical protein
MESVFPTVELDITHLWDIVLPVINLVKIVRLSQLNVLLALQDILNLELTVSLDAQSVNISILQANNA